jgi:hypothetical protein
VNDDVSVIDKDPMTVVQSLDAQRPYTFSGKLFFYVFGNGLDLSRAFSGTDNKVVRNNGEIAEIQDNRIPGLFLKCRPCRFEG